MRKYLVVVILMLGGLACPGISFAQDGALSTDIGGLQTTLNTVYNTMMVHVGELIGIGRGLAGFAALWYIASRVWGHLSRAEPIDFYPLFRPFVIGFAVSIFPSVIALMNGVLQPTVAGTAKIVTDSNQAVATLLQQKEQAIEQSNDWQMFVGPSGSGDLEKWEQLSGEADDGFLSGLSNRIKFEMAKIGYNLRNQVKIWLSEILQVFFEAAALCINTVRTFYLIILAILGPIALGLSVFDGFHHLLVNWLARYINIFLWLPIANIFGSLINQIQQEMIKIDIAQIQATGDTSFGSTDTAYIVFLIMAIIGYFTVPSVANMIVNAGGHGSHLQKISDTSSNVVEGAGTAAKAVAVSAGSALGL